MQTADQLVLLKKELKARGKPENVAGMARFGIHTEKAYGVSLPDLQELARQHRRNHPLALALWEEGWRETRILAALIDDPKQVTEEQMEAWLLQFDSWEIVDQVCGKLYVKTPWAWQKAVDWTQREAEYERRAGFVLMTQLAVHDKKAADERFLAFLPLIETHSTDPRNFVKKAVNWALRQLGKRCHLLHTPCLALAHKLASSPDKTARWIGQDARRELENPKILSRIKR